LPSRSLANAILPIAAAAASFSLLDFNEMGRARTNGHDKIRIEQATSAPSIRISLLLMFVIVNLRLVYRTSRLKFDRVCVSQISLAVKHSQAFSVDWVCEKGSPALLPENFLTARHMMIN
jgi:hypothetical protein